MKQFYGEVKKEKLILFNEAYFKNELKHYEGKKIILKLEQYRNKRSINQNNYYWGVVIKLLSDELGYFPEEMHEVCRQKFLTTGKFLIGGDEYVVTKSTGDLKTSEFEEYLSQIRIWASTMEIVIPLPNEIIYDNL